MLDPDEVPTTDVIASYSGALNAAQQGLTGTYLSAAKRTLTDPTAEAEHEGRGTQIRALLAELGVDPTESQEVLFAVLFGTHLAAENLLYVIREAGAPPAFIEGMELAFDTLLTSTMLGCGMQVGRLPQDQPIGEWLEERERLASLARDLDDTIGEPGE